MRKALRYIENTNSKIVRLILFKNRKKYNYIEMIELSKIKIDL